MSEIQAKTNEERESVQIPYFVHEGAVSRLERINKRLWIFMLVLIIALVGTNAGWIVYESQFEDISIEQTGETDTGGNNYFNGTGELTLYGEGTAGYQNQAQENGR